MLFWSVHSLVGLNPHSHNSMFHVPEAYLSIRKTRSDTSLPGGIFEHAKHYTMPEVFASELLEK